MMTSILQDSNTQNRSPKALSEYLVDQDFVSQTGGDRLVQLYNTL